MTIVAIVATRGPTGMRDPAPWSPNAGTHTGHAREHPDDQTGRPVPILPEGEPIEELS